LPYLSSQITAAIEATEQLIEALKLEQQSLKRKLVESKSCSELGVEKNKGHSTFKTLSCTKQGGNSLYNGVMSMFSLPSRLEWLSLYYVPFDWSMLFAITAFISGMMYANALLIYGDDIIKLFESISIQSGR
jgi:hypothetical protein